MNEKTRSQCDHYLYICDVEQVYGDEAEEALKRHFMHSTQLTLSRQLMQLEEVLGVKLFDRSSHSIIFAAIFLRIYLCQKSCCNCARNLSAAFENI